MKVRFDEEADVVYIRLDKSRKIIESQEVERGIVLDFDDRGEVVGIEILGVKKRIPLEQLKELAIFTRGKEYNNGN